MFKKKLLALLLACTTVFSMVGCSYKEAEKEEKKILRVGVAAEYKPWCYKEGEEIKGVDVDILNEVAKRMGNYEIEYTMASFDGMFGLLDSGKVDIVAQQIGITPEREEKYKFSEVYAYNPQNLVVRKEDNSINSLEDLKGKKMWVGPAGLEYEFMRNYKKEHDPNDEIELVISSDLGLESVVQGKVDASGCPALVFDDFVNEGGLDIKMVGDPIYEEHNAYPFRKDCDEELYNKFNEAIKSMKEDGFLTNLYNEYFGMDISKSAVEK